MRALATYVALVVVPVLGLAAILRAGDRLEAPRSVHGAWLIHSDSAAPAATASCERRAFAALPGTLDVAQSGRRLVAAAGAAPIVTLTGEVVGDTVRLEGPVSFTAGTLAGEAGCGENPRLAVTLTAIGNRLSGVARTVGCKACAPLAISAERDTSSTAPRAR